MSTAIFEENYLSVSIAESVSVSIGASGPWGKGPERSGSGYSTGHHHFATGSVATLIFPVQQVFGERAQAGGFVSENIKGGVGLCSEAIGLCAGVFHS